MNLPTINDHTLQELKEKNSQVKQLRLQLGELTGSIDGLVASITDYKSKRNGIARSNLIRETRRLLNELDPDAVAAPLPPPSPLIKPQPRLSHRSYADYCTEIFRVTNQPWLHVDQIVVIFKERYGLVKDKRTIASVLRKHAKCGRHFKAYGGNRFGLLEV